MLRMFLSYPLAVALVCITSGFTFADTSTDDCLRQGDVIGVFYVTKVAGAEKDGVEPGDEVCYRCRYGSRPMVMVFTRETGGRVADLAKQLDAAVADNEDASLRGLVTLLGEDAAKLKQDASKIAKRAEVKHVPVVVAKETKTGPLNYKLPDDVAVTVVVAKDSQVVNTHVFAADKIDIAAVMTDVKQILR